MDKVPLIICHYGASEYLNYTLPCARAANPDKRIVLIGDESNAGMARDHDIEHCYWKNYDCGNAIDVFENVFKDVRGSKCLYDLFWQKFVFKRWFYINNFIKEQGIQRFWHFDSDNMIFAKLADFEHYFQDIDCTEQCRGICMNGFINNSNILDGYIESINNQFEDADYLEDQRKNIEKTVPEGAFTEMRAYVYFRKNSDIRTERLFKIRDGIVFDENYAWSESQYATEPLPSGQLAKRTLVNGKGELFVIFGKNRERVRVASLNLGKVPVECFKTVYDYTVMAPGPSLSAYGSKLVPLRYGPVPIKYRIRHFLNRIKVAQRIFRRIGSIGNFSLVEREPL